MMGRRLTKIEERLTKMALEMENLQKENQDLKRRDIGSKEDIAPSYNEQNRVRVGAGQLLKTKRARCTKTYAIIRTNTRRWPKE